MLPRLVPGGILMVGLPGPSLDSRIVTRLDEIRPAGILLFRRNLTEPERLRELLDELDERLAPHGPRIAIDQEGGRVSRLAGWIGATPTAWSLGRAGPDRAREFGGLTGAALRALGIDLDFAPVVDLCAPGASNGIGDRAFGADPEVVIECAGAFLDGLRAQGVEGCLKHFPGLGGTSVDSHLALPRVVRSGEESERHLRPFRALRDAADLVMVGHGYHPEWAGPVARPAIAVSEIVRDLLRDAIGFTGTVVTDDLEMGAVAALDERGALAVRALRAGCDLLVYASDLDRAARAAAAIGHAAREDPAIAARLVEARARVEGLAARRPARHVRLHELARLRSELARLARELAVRPDRVR